VRLERLEVDGVPVIGLADSTEIDVGNVDDFKRSFIEQLAASDRTVVLDASRIEFVDSAGMSALLTIHKHLQHSDGELVLAALNRSVLEVFRMVGFDIVFRNHATVGQALDSLQPSGSASPEE